MHPLPFPTARCWRAIRRAVPLGAVAAAATLGLSATGSVHPTAVALTAGSAVDLGQGTSVTPVPGWTVADRGRGWARMSNDFSTAELEIKIKPATATDPVAGLQADIDQLSNGSTTGLTDVGNLGSPVSKPLQSSRFQQEVSMSYHAEGSSRMGPIPVMGWFMELQNGSTGQSAFVVFTQNGDAPGNADDDAGAMIDSML